MKQLFYSIGSGLLCLAACGPTDTPDAISAVSDAAVETVRKISWEELLPEGEEERLLQLYEEQITSYSTLGDIAEGGVNDVAVQIGSFNTVPELDGVKVRLPGYTVPFEYGVDAEITEFLLVPYFGACLHAPPPPPNQTIYVTATTPLKLKDLAQAVWIEGTIRATIQSTGLADAAYTVELDSMEAY